MQAYVRCFNKSNNLKGLVLGLGLENYLERSANLATKTWVHIEFYGHIDKILRRMI